MHEKSKKELSSIVDDDDNDDDISSRDEADSAEESNKVSAKSEAFPVFFTFGDDIPRFCTLLLLFFLLFFFLLLWFLWCTNHSLVIVAWFCRLVDHRPRPVQR